MKHFLNKKIIFGFFLSFVAFSFSGKVALAVWSGQFYNPGETYNPECLSSETNCDVLVPFAFQANLFNYFFGKEAGNATMTGDKNTATGYQALRLLTTGYHNTTNGYKTLYDNTTGNDNTVIGYNSGLGITTGSNNTILGANVTGLPANLSNTVIIADGAGAKFIHNFAVSGTNGNNIFMGMNAGNFTMAGSVAGIDGSENVAIGGDNLSNNTTGARNTAIGYHSLFQNTTGSGNTAIGLANLRQNTTGNNNVGLGNNALYSNTSGVVNVAIGYRALFSNTTGGGNIVSGSNTMDSNTTGNNNIVLGGGALTSNTTGSNNIVIGTGALGQLDITLNDDSGNNIAIGANTGIGITSGINNTIIGANVITSDVSNNIIIADGAGNQRINVGSTGNVGIGTTAPGYTLHVVGNIYASGNITCGGTCGSGGGANTALSNLASVAINTSLLPGVDDSIDLGDNTHRWRDLYLGPATLHIGTETGDEGTISYATANNVLGVQSTGNIALQATGGNVGIGTTAPTQALDIVGSIALPMTVDATSGVIYKGSSPFIHNFALPGTDGFNTFVGMNSGNFTMTGSTGTQGSYNVGTGQNTLFSNTTGSGNTANGAYSLRFNTTGSNNTAIGNAALRSNTTGDTNVATGHSALYSNTTGSGNVASGYYSLYSNTIGEGNVAIGTHTLTSNSTGTGNTATGYSALNFNTTGNYNTVSGDFALPNLGKPQTAGDFAIGVSYTIKTSGTTDFTLIGAVDNNPGTVFTATGVGVGDGTATANDTSNNTAIGYNTGEGIFSGINNTILGANVTGLPSTLSNNIIIADGAGNQRINVTASGAVGIGVTNPTAKLVVEDIINSGTSAIFQNSNGGAANASIKVLGGVNAISTISLGSLVTPEKGLISYDNSNDFLSFVTNNTKKMTISSSGNVGIGITAPTEMLHMVAAAGLVRALIQNTDSDGFAEVSLLSDTVDMRLGAGGSTSGYQVGYFDVASGHDFQILTDDTTRMTVTASGNVGIGTTAPTHQFELSTDDAAKPTSNTWTIISDERLKQNIQNFNDGLNVISQINTVSYELNGKAGTTLGAKGIGIIAQNVKDIIPYTIGTFEAKLNPEDTEKTTLYNFNSSALTFVSINAIKELNLNLESISGKITPLPESNAKIFTDTFFSNIFVKINTWMADTTNGIGDFFANRIRTKEICVNDNAGETCITRAQLDSLLSNSGNVSTPLLESVPALNLTNEGNPISPVLETNPEPEDSVPESTAVTDPVIDPSAPEVAPLQ